jgi:hypothetical protein
MGLLEVLLDLSDVLLVALRVEPSILKYPRLNIKARGHKVLFQKPPRIQRILSPIIYFLFLYKCRRTAALGIILIVAVHVMDMFISDLFWPFLSIILTRHRANIIKTRLMIVLLLYRPEAVREPDHVQDPIGDVTDEAGPVAVAVIAAAVRVVAGSF